MADAQATIQTYKLLAQAVKLCRMHGLEHAVLCPGSRSAAPALSFLRNKDITSYTLPDERSAAYTAMGIARQSQRPVALVCTSGTAALNFAPAVAEAFFSEMPLLVFTADRPAEWIGQADNQSIYQENLYGKNVKASYSLPVDVSHPDAAWYALRQMNEAINTALRFPQGPVQVNIPLREPLYLSEIPAEDDIEPKMFSVEHISYSLNEKLWSEMSSYSRVLIVGGTMAPSDRLGVLLDSLCSKKNVVFLPDITSNLHGIKASLPFAELTLDTADKDLQQDLLPELVISFGGPIVSKTVKQFLRSSAIKEHWYIGPDHKAADTYQRLSRIIPVDALSFLQALERSGFSASGSYQQLWLKAQQEIQEKARKLLSQQPFSEISAMRYIMERLSAKSILHLGNSLPVRYASVFPFLDKGVRVFANRGTSGIDGSLSAAAGQSIAAKESTHTLVLGDLSFMYDRNGLWNNYLGPNLKIIVLNNHGGGIFRALPGPAAQPELEEYFVVQQPLNFEHTALQHGCKYIYSNTAEKLEEALEQLYAPHSKPAILELDFSSQLMMADIKKQLRS